MKNVLRISVIFIFIIIISCSSVNIDIFINEGRIEEAEDYCSSLSGEERNECFIRLAKYYIDNYDYQKAYDSYIKAGDIEKANNALISMKKTIKIIELNENKEYVLIKNTGINNVPMDNWSLKDKNAKHEFIFDEYILNSDKILQIQSGNINVNKQKQEDDYDYIIWSDKNIWNNEGDIAYLYDDNNILISKFPDDKD